MKKMIIKEIKENKNKTTKNICWLYKNEKFFIFKGIKWIILLLNIY